MSVWWQNTDSYSGSHEAPVPHSAPAFFPLIFALMTNSSLWKCLLDGCCLVRMTTVDIGKIGGGAGPHWGRDLWEQEPDGDPVADES